MQDQRGSEYLEKSSVQAPSWIRGRINGCNPQDRPDMKDTMKIVGLTMSHQVCDARTPIPSRVGKEKRVQYLW